MSGIHKLGKTDTGIRGTLAPGRYADGGGLYLQVATAKPDPETHAARLSKSWIFRYRVTEREREMGLGAYPLVSLADARTKADACRRMRDEGIDPLAARDAQRANEAARAARATSFRECAESYIAAHESAWRNPKHRQQWRNTLKTYVYPLLAELPASAIDTPLVLKVLEQQVRSKDGAGKPVRRTLWEAKPETAGRVRGRIESILDWAKARKLREGENPAAWRGNLAHALPMRSKVHTVQHHAALPYGEIAPFLRRLGEHPGTAALALRFLVLTATRTGEVLGAKWSEIDGRTWTIPAARMKAKKEHRVPLSDAALAALKAAETLRTDAGYVFPGAKRGRPLSNMAMLELLRGMRLEVTAHGFRSTFRDWAAECTEFPRELAEAALAHTLESKVEAAYQRGDLFNKRRGLMAAWAAFCLRTSNIVPLETTRAAS